MELDIREAILTPKQQRDLRGKRCAMLFGTCYLVWVTAGLAVLVAVYAMSWLDPGGFLAWGTALVFGALLPAGCVTAVYGTYTAWYSPDKT